MRDVKFMAWDKIDKVIRTVGCINFFDEYVDMDENPSGKRVRRNIEDVILLQYAGLKDRKGVDICEGDILKNYLSHKYGNGKTLWKVVFSEGGFSLLSIPMGERINRYERPCDFIRRENWEVIGDIYSNPELLGATDAK